MLAEATTAELKKLRGLLSTLPPGDCGPLACLAGTLLLTEAVRDYQLAQETADDAEVRRACGRLHSPELTSGWERTWRLSTQTAHTRPGSTADMLGPHVA